MTDESIKGYAAIVLAVLFVGMACWVSNADYCHTKVATMSEDTYDSVLNELSQAGNDAPTEVEIAEWWEKHHGN